MKNILKFLFIIFLFFNIQNLHAGNVYFIDFNKVLNESIAGKKAQDSLKKKFSTESGKFNNIEKSLIEKEREIISKRKILAKEEYQKQVIQLRKDVTKVQKDKKNSLNNLGKMRAKARTELLSKLNPILKAYMEKNKIQIVIDKKEVLYGNSVLEITNQIMEILNKEVKSLNLK
jgi:outer membrane protein